MIGEIFFRPLLEAGAGQNKKKTVVKNPRFIGPNPFLSRFPRPSRSPSPSVTFGDETLID